jgi:3-dehydroquinate dehydratase/shikimate dehydrogenase
VAGICVSLTEGTTAATIDRMVELADCADLFEIRADFVQDLDLLTLRRTASRPLLLACRSRSQGGRWEDDDPQRRLTLLEGVKRGYEWVDVESNSRLLDVMLEKSGNGLVVSHHDLAGTPEDLDGLYQRMADLGADVVKIAVTPRSIRDVGRLLEFAARAALGAGPPVISLALGPMGLVTRVLAGRHRAPFTYAAPAAGAEAAPGQLAARDMAGLFRARELTAATRVYGILGRDVAGSLSPLLHNRAFQARGLDAVYVPLQADSLEGFLAHLPAFGVSGFAVTRPYKVAIVPHLASVDDEAARCGSVNTVVVREGRLHGLNTDAAGVMGPLSRRLDVRGKQAVILGAGGAARAAALTLRRQGARVNVLARREEEAAEVAATVGCAHGTLSALGRYAWDLLINATPVGSAAAPDRSLVPPEAHRPDSVVFDMVYDPLETRLLREAHAAGCTIVDGLEMLLAQAMPQFEAWTGMEAPAEAMRAAAVRWAQERLA